MTIAKRPPRSSMRGVTLVELMVAMVIGLILMAGVGTVYVNSKRGYRIQQAASQVQENGRYAMQFLSRDIRMAGYSGCGAGSTRMANVIKNSGTLPWYFDLTRPILGYNSTTTFPSQFASSVVAGTDAVTVVRGDDSKQDVITHHNPTSATFTLAAPSGIPKGTILLVSDCKYSAVFQMSGPTGSTTSAQVDHNTGNAVSPGNCTKNLGTNGAAYADCNSMSNLTTYTYQGNGQLMRLVANAYYIGNNADGVPSLYRAGLTTVGTAPTITNEELVDGVENMQIRYGEAAAPDQAAVRYVPADQVTDWGNVVTARVQLLVRSLEQVNPTPVSVTFNGQTYSDRYLRRIFTDTIKLRNRGLR
ncbi:MAG: PilW family protein [Gammaproteobacteria bacterium]